MPSGFLKLKRQREVRERAFRKKKKDIEDVTDQDGRIKAIKQSEKIGARIQSNNLLTDDDFNLFPSDTRTVYTVRICNATHSLFPFKYFLRKKTFCEKRFLSSPLLRLCRRFAVQKDCRFCTHPLTYGTCIHTYTTHTQDITAAALSGCSRNGCHCEEVKKSLLILLHTLYLLLYRRTSIRFIRLLFLPGFSSQSYPPVPFHSPRLHLNSCVG